ncbi:MAG: stage V sporulation T C-terminal domain-containing protein [Lachnospiraceae bacterium]|nr:AbrB/MazE/SpoVT family DNA-binding domain-containing protein [Agathobacter sp.]MDD6291452.1 stage V sporulation T C-terminal domain-containing protein [Lachnospiraceae bacterium]
MKATGIVRRIDDLGRIVVPKEIRRTLRIREGDPLEIFTNREGEIVLKKYSPVGELGEFATCYAQSLAQVVEALVCITDRDYVIAAAGSGRKEVEGEHLSSEVEALIERRGTFVVSDVDQELPIVTKNWKSDYKGSVVSSIICNGDCQGAVIMLEKTGQSDKLDVLKILAMSAANFLGKNMEQ